MQENASGGLNSVEDYIYSSGTVWSHNNHQYQRQGGILFKRKGVFEANGDIWRLGIVHCL
jgi:hypothetical protein